MLEAVVADTNDKVDLAKVDIDEHPELAIEYQVSRTWEGEREGEY